MQQGMNEEYYSYIRNWFRREARFYHVLVDIPFSRVRDRIARSVNARNGSRILDVATGTGGLAFAFAKRGYDVVGIDLSEDMLRVADGMNEYQNLRFEVADAADMPFEDSHFDVSCISLGLHDMPLAIREKTVAEMVRVTKPRGIILIVDYALPQNRIGSCLIYRLVKSHETKYFPEFIESDLGALLARYNIGIENDIPIALGCGRILKGTNEK